MVGSDSANGNGFSQGRWPRQETLTLLEIRTRLHPKFKHAAAQKAPLWDEVSRIMAEEYGYQRTGKKCKEKLDNLYKYYKKTIARGKGGSHNGKHYRFFKQLEALYGENSTSDHLSTNTQIRAKENQEAINLILTANPSESDDSTSREDEEEEEEEEIEDLIEMLMRRLMEVQETWLERMLEAVERMERERIFREEAWQKRELARHEQEERVWACERLWMEARDAVLINALERISCKCCDDHEEKKNRNEINESDLVVTDDNDEISNLITIQNWVQVPEIESYGNNGLLN